GRRRGRASALRSPVADMSSVRRTRARSRRRAWCQAVSRGRDDRLFPRFGDPEPRPGVAGWEVEAGAAAAASVDHEAADLHRRLVVAGPEHELVATVD